MMNYEDFEREVSWMLEEVQTEDEDFDDVTDAEDNPIQHSMAQEELIHFFIL